MDGCKQFIVSYNHDGASWGVTIWAKDEADCKRRMYAISVGQVDGELMMTIPGSVGFLAPIIVRLRNLFVLGRL